jgi:hypothetical protein
MPKKQQKRTLAIQIEKAEKKDHSANADVVTSSITAVSSIISAVHEGYKEDRAFLLKARPFGPGSLVIYLDLIVFIDTDESPLWIEFINAIETTLAEFVKIKLALAGKDYNVESENVIVFENQRLAVKPMIIQLLRPGSTTDQNFNLAFGAAENDPDVTSLRIFSDNPKKDIIDVPRADFKKLVVSVSKDSVPPPKRIESNELVTIRSVSFEPNLSWHFYWNQRPISAKITDMVFSEKIQSRQETFRCGDLLEVNLIRVQEYDPWAKSFVDKQYIISQVVRHLETKDPPNEGLFPP